MSGAGALYGKLIQHAAALASTVRERVPLEEAGAVLRQVAEYTRGAQAKPYRVMHDATVNRPYGRFAVYVGDRRVGAQLSFPSEADCRRMENPPAPLRPYEERLSKSARLALGVMTPTEKAEKSQKNRDWYERKKAHQRVIGRP